MITTDCGRAYSLLLSLLIFLLSSCSGEPTAPSAPVVDKKSAIQEQLLLTHPEDNVPQTMPTLAGVWMSAEPERAGNGRYILREYEFKLGKATMKTIWASDREFQRVLLIEKTEASFLIETPGRDQEPAGIFFISFQPTKRTLNLFHRDPDFLKDLDLPSCGLIPGREKDITQVGCGDFQSVANCREEFDLVKMNPKKKELYFGERPANNEICTADKRPDALTFPLRPK